MKEDYAQTEYAFPITNDAANNGDTGMSLRDYFAAKAINSIMLHPQGKAGDFNEAAKDAYEIADAMMGARK